MPNSQIRWPLLVVMIVVLVLAGLAESKAQKAPDISFDRGFAPLVKQIALLDKRESICACHCSG